MFKQYMKGKIGRHYWR